MNIGIVISYAAAIGAAGLAGYVLLRDLPSTVHRVFAAGMVLLAADALLTGFASGAALASDFLFWQQVRIAVTALLPGTWLVFSLCYARANYRMILARWKWSLAGIFVIPALLAGLFRDNFFTAGPLSDRATWEWYLPLGPAGYAFNLIMIVGSILILMNLERTFRYTTGHLRWQVKFMILGVAGLFAARIYTDSLALLFRAVNTDLLVINAGALIIACVLMARSAARTRRMDLDIYLSHSLLHSSFTVLLVGVYFIGVGVLAWLARTFGGVWSLPLTAFVLFAAIMCLGALLLSDTLRTRRRRIVSELFKRPLYDYRQVWSSFTEKTTSVSSIRELSGAVVKMVAETLEALTVSLWIVDEQRNTLFWGGSTEFSAQRAKSMALSGATGTALYLAMYDRDMPLDLEDGSDERIWELVQKHGDALRQERVKYVVPVNGAGRLVAILTMGRRISNDPLSREDYELLKTIADQAGANILSLRLSERVSELKEMEALQVMSAFFMHDLKNLGARLSLVSQNLPVYHDNPEFRSDAIRTISQSVAKVNALCSRLLMLSQKLEIRPSRADLNELVRATLASLDGHFRGQVTTELGGMPPVAVDIEQFQKVLENLLLNANEAVADGGRIRVTTGARDAWVEITVSDDGCGMSADFVEKRLFRPFQTTKKQGMGIGLFHSRTIVEAHGGRIEVQSAERKGTTFRVILPAGSGQGRRGAE
jgi:putative PEP-CTERM system histidine kinase